MPLCGPALFLLCLPLLLESFVEDKANERTACCPCIIPKASPRTASACATLFVKDPGRRLWLHLLMLGAGLASLAWALGDRWLVGAGRHVLDGDAFHLRVGARTTGSIPRHAILGCEPLTVARAEWCRRHGVDPRRSLLASPLDKPNTVLILDPDSAVRLTHLGMERGGLSCVFLYLDQPQALASALGKA